MRLMFESCNERPGCDRDCVSFKSGSGTVHLRARSSSSPSRTPSYWSTALALPAPLNRGLSICKSLSYGQNAASAAAGLGSSRDAQQSIDVLEALLAGGAHQDAAYQRPITTNDVKKAINLRNRLQRVRQKMSAASATDITSGPETSKDA